MGDTRTFDETELDALFRLPLAEFTPGRNALSAKLKKAGLAEDANRIKSLPKPPVSAWAVNQLYWEHRDLFDVLMEAGQRVAQAHALQLAGKSADTQGTVAARRDALSQLLRAADRLLRNAGHNPGTDTIRRISATLEALSTYSSLPDGPRAGRLIGDVDPPGFETMAALFRVATPVPVEQSEGKSQPKTTPAKAAFIAAEKALHAARVASQETAELLKEAAARANAAEKERSEAETSFHRASAAAEEARQRLSKIEAQARSAGDAVRQAEDNLEIARRELD